MPMVATPLVPKDPTVPLRVVAMGRISTVHQDIENIEASYRYIQDYLHRIYQGPMNIKLLGEQASGMLTDRATIREAEELVASGKVDLMIAEDLARIYRNPRHQYRFVQDCVDQGTRVICVGDSLDTADENWEITLGAAALRHGLHIPDTRRRVRRTATHAFHRGGMVQKIRYGYRRLSAEQAASAQFGPQGLRIARRPECTPIIRQMMDRVMRGDPYAAVADWLQSEGAEPGPYVKSGRWTARLVVELLDGPILSGTRTFRDTICRPIFRTGKHKSVKNAEPEMERCPELAHLTIEEHTLLRQEIACRRAQRKGQTPQLSKRRGIPRSRSLWPGQAVACAVCGGLMYYSGQHLRCRNSLARFGGSCWNHVQVPTSIARERTIAWLVRYLPGHGSARHALAQAVWTIVDRSRRRSGDGNGDLPRDIASMERQAANLAAAIAEGGRLHALVEKLKAIETALKQARAVESSHRDERAAQGGPSSVEDVEKSLEPVLRSLTDSSLEFADVMRRLFPKFVVHPVQSLDHGQVRPRVRFTFCPSALGALGAHGPIEQFGVADVEVVFDLFDPPLHILHMSECTIAKREHPDVSLKGLAMRLGINHMTVKRALDYARRMETDGIDDSYRELQERPTSASRWHRTKRTLRDRQPAFST